MITYRKGKLLPYYKVNLCKARKGEDILWGIDISPYVNKYFLFKLAEPMTDRYHLFGNSHNKIEGISDYCFHEAYIEWWKEEEMSEEYL